LRDVHLGQDPLAGDLAQLPVNRTGSVHRLLAEGDAPSAIHEMPVENRQPTFEPVRPNR
jgi:hypothetical protein